MPKPKFLKPVLIGCACALPVGLVVGLSVNWEHRMFISSVGSSGVKPFIESFGKEYIAQNPKIDVQVESGGTTFAIEQVAKGLTNVGNASNNPYYTINYDSSNSYLSQWGNKKTFTLGWEGLVIMYKMPNGLRKEIQDQFDIVITEDNILDLYAVFSGFAESKNPDGTTRVWDATEKAEKSSIYYYMTQEAKDALNEAETKKCKDTKITTFVRSGGNTAANSSIAFTYYSNLKDFDDMTQNQQNAFTDGHYGSFCERHQSEESNARAWEMFKNINVPGSMVYLTTGFIKNKDNQKAIINSGYKLAGYKPSSKYVSNPEVVSLSKEGDLKKICHKPEKIGDDYYGYNWYRPINCMIDVNNKLAKDFINWIYEDTSRYEKIVRDNGGRPLSSDEIDSMKVQGEMFVRNACDIELLAARRILYGTDDNTYGAEELWKKL